MHHCWHCKMKLRQGVQPKQNKNEHLNAIIRARQQQSLLRGPSPMYLERDYLNQDFRIRSSSKQTGALTAGRNSKWQLWRAVVPETQFEAVWSLPGNSGSAGSSSESTWAALQSVALHKSHRWKKHCSESPALQEGGRVPETRGMKIQSPPNGCDPKPGCTKHPWTGRLLQAWLKPLSNSHQ